MGLLKQEYLPCYTYDDYIQWKGDWELVEGIAYAMSPSPMFTHQALSSLFIQAIGKNLKDCKSCMVVSEMDYKVADDTILRPDITLVCGQTTGSYIKKSPELIVEIVSKSSATRDEKIKFSLYQAEKVTYYILLYPEDLKAKIYELQNGKYEKVIDLLEGSLDFENLECPINIDFDFIFERFR
ncbi:MAG: Uma2 family endonuclease [Campylobacterota bacterium]|nr:Uma2 family endonuclease [Campylobacterota bacterium]